jgi:protein phosphatase
VRATLLAVVALVAVVWVIDRQFWFVGTDDQGRVTLYQGLPYDLPLGIAMYSEKGVSNVPAAAIRDMRQRRYVLDHHARGHGDSVALFRQIQAGHPRP